MNKIENIKAILAEYGVQLVGEIIDDGLEDRFFVFIEVVRNSDNLQIPSNLKLQAISRKFRELELNVEFILSNRENTNLEGVVRSTILHHFGDLVRNSFVSKKGDEAFLWVVPKRKLSEPELSSIKSKVAVVFESAGANFTGILSTNSANLPSKTVTLSVIREFAPIEMGALHKKLVERRFDVPSSDWLMRLLDNLRKSLLITRRKNGAYVATLNGLRALGTTKDRRSPDVKRLLELARRKA